MNTSPRTDANVKSPAREAWSRLLGSTLFRFLVICLILYTVYHCIIAASPRMTTAVVDIAQESEVTEGTATVFRDETVLQTAGQGLLLSYPLENGAKVSATSTPVILYGTLLSGDELAAMQQRLRRLDDSIVELRRATRQYSPASTAMGAASLGAVYDDIRDRILLLAREADGLTRAELLLALHTYEELTEENVTAVDPLEAMVSERSALLATVARSSRAMTVSELLPSHVGEEGMTSFSGYFYNAAAVDGYEGVFSREQLATMNVMDYDAMMQTPRTDYSAGATLLGKVVGSYEWSITLSVDYALADRLKTGEKHTVTFPEEGGVTVQMTLDRIVRSVGDGRAILVLSCDTMPEGFSYVRHQTARLTLQMWEGYRIPDTALQTVEGRECVYVLEGGCVRLREITVLLRGEGYVLLAVPDEEFENGLSRHDVVITSGKDLYDGKYID